MDTHGMLQCCYFTGNALSSSMLFPSDLDEQSVAARNDSYNLEQSTEHIGL